MDKLGLLINNLQDLYKSGASEEQMVGVSLEILSALTTPYATTPKTEKVSIIMPNYYVSEHNEETLTPPKQIEEVLVMEQSIIEEHSTLIVTEAELVLTPVSAKIQPTETELNKFKASLIAIKEAEENHLAEYLPKIEAPILPFSTAIRNVVAEFNEHHEIKEVFELKDTLTTDELTINDQLKDNQVEINHNIKLEPVKDIKRAFNINEKYVFINELFRGDDAMFERSLKTINAFQIYPEAQYWIQRELKVKLGWNENSTTVQHFDTLVKRRFAS